MNNEHNVDEIEKSFENFQALYRKVEAPREPAIDPVIAEIESNACPIGTESIPHAMRIQQERIKRTEFYKTMVLIDAVSEDLNAFTAGVAARQGCSANALTLSSDPSCETGTRKFLKRSPDSPVPVVSFSPLAVIENSAAKLHRIVKHYSALAKTIHVDERNHKTTFFQTEFDRSFEYDFTRTFKIPEQRDEYMTRLEALRRLSHIIIDAVRTYGADVQDYDAFHHSLLKRCDWKEADKYDEQASYHQQLIAENCDAYLDDMSKKIMPQGAGFYQK